MARTTSHPVRSSYTATTMRFKAGATTKLNLACRSAEDQVAAYYGPGFILAWMVTQTRAAEVFYADNWQWNQVNTEDIWAAVFYPVGALLDLTCRTCFRHQNLTFATVRAPWTILQFEAWFCIFVLYRSVVKGAQSNDLRDAIFDGAIVWSYTTLIYSFVRFCVARSTCWLIVFSCTISAFAITALEPDLALPYLKRWAIRWWTKPLWRKISMLVFSLILPLLLLELFKDYMWWPKNSPIVSWDQGMAVLMALVLYLRHKGNGIIELYRKLKAHFRRVDMLLPRWYGRPDPEPLLENVAAAVARTTQFRVDPASTRSR